ncbi:17873_t:CDS:2 [Acaulospora morrowiae]|uniref:17873_t:CDS:1 n=1 Tax=Acaulospora morrowiae TaxID=94023 RepID=A0A9N9GS03_9GLOM|nr:17873_t:CDS:2 [Acaulospora morrowiae]
MEDPPTNETNLLTNEQIENILTWSDSETFTDDTTTTKTETRNHPNNEISIVQIPTETTTSKPHITQHASTTSQESTSTISQEWHATTIGS